MVVIAVIAFVTIDYNSVTVIVFATVTVVRVVITVDIVVIAFIVVPGFIAVTDAVSELYCVITIGANITG